MLIQQIYTTNLLLSSLSTGTALNPHQFKEREKNKTGAQLITLKDKIKFLKNQVFYYFFYILHFIDKTKH